MRNEIKKMGTEGVKLLEQREKEINEMRIHLKNVLKVLEEKYKVRDFLRTFCTATLACVMITSTILFLFQMKASSLDLVGVVSKQDSVKVEPMPVKQLKSAKSVKSNKSVPNALKPRSSVTKTLSKPKASVTKQPSKTQPTA